MEQILGKEWQVIPAGGVTGEAYYAQHGDQKLFLKRNSSPFLAVLSAEGIVPKLLWTKRLENGDVVTAQRWVNGRELTSSQMKSEIVAKLLSKIHRSKELLNMFKRIGNKPLTPFFILNELNEQLFRHKINDPSISHALHYLSEHIDEIECDNREYVVCHCDINHHNWILNEDGSLFLIDWDGAMVADPALDIGLLLFSYIPENEWPKWLDDYGMKLDLSLYKRMYWYVVAQTVSVIIEHYNRGDHVQMNNCIAYLSDILENNLKASL